MGINTYGKGFVEETMNTPKIIAVDFDGTLVEDRYPEIGEIRLAMWKSIMQAKEDGCKIILWTCRTDEYLTAAVEFCERHGLLFDAVNDNLPETKATYGGNTRKVFADLYIDDRNGALSYKSGFIRLKTELLSSSKRVCLSHSTVRVCSVCGKHDDFNIICPICGSQAFSYVT